MPQWHNATFSRRRAAPQDSENNGENGGPCRDRTYDQLIKRNFFQHYISIYKTATCDLQTVPRFHDLPPLKALNSLVKAMFGGTRNSRSRG
jgi:hypothetical protein